MVGFRVGAADAEYLETEFEPAFTPNDLVNMPKYNVILKLMINGVSSEPFTAITMPINEKHRSNNAEKVIRVSRERYGNPVAEVEERISRWMGAEFHEQSAVMIGSAEEEADPMRIEALVGAKEYEEMPTPKDAPTPVVREMETPKEQVAAPALAPTPIPKSEPIPVAAEQEQPKPPVVENTKPIIASMPQPPKPQPAPDRTPFQNRPAPKRDFAPKQRKPFGNQRGPKKVVRPPQKRDNPIWDTVATVQEQKIEQLFTPKPAPTQESNPLPRPEPVNQIETDKEVIQPGEVHKF
jgi:hypothetical protein